MDLEPTPSLTADDGGQGVPTNANEVSVVAVLCGTDSCDPNTWNGLRLMDRTTLSSDDSDATDLGPLYRPQTSTTEEQVDEDLAHEKRTNKFATPIAIAIPLAAVIAFIIWFSLYRRKRRAKQKASEGGDDAGPYGQLESGDTSPATSETFNYNQQPITRLTSHTTAGSNRTSMFTVATPPPPLPYRRSAHHEASRPQSLGPVYYSPLNMNAPAQAQTAEAEAPLPEQPQPAHTTERIRTNTFSDVPSDDLPPYVDPIEEAMAETGSRPASLHDHRHSQTTMQSPPPYDTITLPG